GDLIIAVNGEEIKTNSKRFVDLIAASGNQEMLWTIKRDGTEQVIKITPNVSEGKGKVGIGIDLSTRPATVKEIVTGAGTMMWDFTKEIFIGFKKLILLQFKLDDLGGP